MLNLNMGLNITFRASWPLFGLFRRIPSVPDLLDYHQKGPTQRRIGVFTGKILSQNLVWFLEHVHKAKFKPSLAK
jgi:hypothetical protein